jgi:hypothetical protein
MRLDSDGAGGTRVHFDQDAPNSGDWPFLVTTLEKVSPVGLTWAQLSGGGGGSSPNPPPAGPQVALTTSTLSLSEGGAGQATEFAFTVSRTGATSGTSTVNWATTGSGSNPANGADFVGGALPAGAITFAAGEASKTILVRVAGDSVVESNEGFTVTLSGASSGTTLGAATAAGTIVNDDSGGATPPPPAGGGQVLTSARYGDTLSGGTGDDTLNAGQGPDQLTGGGGADHFAFAKTPWNAGKVADFAPGTDKIDLRGVFDQTAYSGTNPLADHWLILEAGDGGVRVLVDMDGPSANGDWPITITTLTGVSASALSAADFIA